MKSGILLFFIVLVFLVTGCESKSKQLKSSSPDGNASILVAGKKTGMSPWQLEITVTVNGKSTPPATTEFHAPDLTTDNIAFNWIDNNNCIIKLTEQDGVVRTVPVQF